MRALDFTRDIDYRQIFTAIFTDDVGREYVQEVVVCEDYDEDEDGEYAYFPTMDSLTHDEHFVRLASNSWCTAFGDYA